MAIDPTELFVIVELERIKWFLSKLDLTKDDSAGEKIQEAYTQIDLAIKYLKRAAL